MNQRNDRPIGRWLGNAFAILVTAWIAAVVALPMIWLIMTSFKSGPDITSLKPIFVFKPTLENYAAIVGDSRVPIVEAMINSIVVSVISTIVSVVLAALAAYSLARLRPPGYRFIGLTIFGARMLPPVALVIPLFLAANWVGQLDTRLSLIVPYIALSIPLGTWMLQGFFLDLPKELEEAALVDGASHLQAFLRVILPLAGPGLAAVSIFSFSLSWNDLVLALPLTSDRAITLPVIASRIRTDEGILWGQLGAITTIIMLPMLIFTLLVQRWLIRGLTAGAVKG